MAYRKFYKRGGASNASTSRSGAAVTSTGGKDVVIELDKKKQVTVRQFNGINLVDIREFYYDKDTKEKKPGKKGISLTEDSWLKLVENQSNIQDALDRFNGLGASSGTIEPPTKKPKTEKKPAESEEEENDDDEFEDVTEAKPNNPNNKAEAEPESESEEE